MVFLILIILITVFLIVSVMGIIKRGILGGVSGKVANVIGGSWKGIEYLRAMPLSVANPRTTAQVANRDRFKSVTVLASEMLTTIVKPLWDRFAVSMSGYNDFCKTNKDVFSEGTFNHSSLILSRGKMDAPVGLFGSVNSTAHTFTVSWGTTLSDAYASADDEVYIAVLGADGSLAAASSGSAKRSEGTVTFSYPTTWKSTAAFAYVAFRRKDGTIVSNSAVIPLD